MLETIDSKFYIWRVFFLLLLLVCFALFLYLHYYTALAINENFRIFIGCMANFQFCVPSFFCFMKKYILVTNLVILVCPVFWSFKLFITLLYCLITLNIEIVWGHFPSLSYLHDQFHHSLATLQQFCNPKPTRLCCFKFKPSAKDDMGIAGLLIHTELQLIFISSGFRVFCLISDISIRVYLNMVLCLF